VSLAHNIADRRALVVRLIMAELLARRGEGPLARLTHGRADLRTEEPPRAPNLTPEPKP